MSFDPSSRVRLKPTTAHHFGGDTLFDRIARVVCNAECLPRKELYESWEVARRARRRFKRGRIVDLACGHGLSAWIMLLLDDASPGAVCIDKRIPQSAARLTAALTEAFPKLAGRVEYREGDLNDLALTSEDVVLSIHACGELTDEVLDRAVAARAKVAVLPCCHSENTCDPGNLGGWMDFALAVDATRARKLAARGYRVHTQQIPEAITPKNRLLLGWPLSSLPDSA